MDLAQVDALHADGDFDEAAGLGVEIRQSVEALNAPRCCWIELPQLADGEGPAEIAELAFALDVFIDVDPRQFEEVVVVACLHDVAPCERETPR